jgi:hypothetical protein
MAFKLEDLKKPLMPAVVITAVVLALNYILSWLNYPIAGLFSAVGPVSPITGTLGNKVLGWIGGVIPIGNFLGYGLIAVIISAYLILLVGGFLVDTVNLPSAKSKVGKLVSAILWGAAVFYLLLMGFKMVSWGAALGLVVYTVAVAFIASYLADKVNVSL